MPNDAPTSDLLVSSSPPPVCQWADHETEGWQTACGEAFVFIDGGPKENKFQFCPYCGRKVSEASD